MLEASLKIRTCPFKTIRGVDGLLSPRIAGQDVSPSSSDSDCSDFKYVCPADDLLPHCCRFYKAREKNTDNCKICLNRH